MSRPNTSGALKISIHAPRAGSDIYRIPADTAVSPFQSTLPVRGATVYDDGLGRAVVDFNPRSPCGERPAHAAAGCLNFHISIHAPRAGSDPRILPSMYLYTSFQSTLPVRGATDSNAWVALGAAHFNPRSPCGERRPPVHRVHRPHNFNPRSPCGERLLLLPALAREKGNFNPRSPCGERRASGNDDTSARHFNPRSPCGERPDDPSTPEEYANFNPRSPCGERPDVFPLDFFNRNFNPRSPCGERPAAK